MSEKSKVSVTRVFWSRNGWWVRSGNSYQEVKEPAARLIQERLEATGGPVVISYVNAGAFPDNYLDEVDLLS